MAQEPTTISVELLFRFEADLGSRPPSKDAPHGTRVIVNVTGGYFEGPRLKGTLQAPTGDWVTVRGEGSFKLDARVTLQTHDGALILMTYIGIFTEDGVSLRTAPLFETSDPRYAWLTCVQAVGVGGRIGESRVGYDVYAVL